MMNTASQFIDLKTDSLELTDDLNVHTTLSGRHECDVCNKTFTRPGILKVHKIIHSGDRPYICTVSYKAFNREGHFKEHIRTHTGERPYSCDNCEKAFKSSSL